MVFAPGASSVEITLSRPQTRDQTDTRRNNTDLAKQISCELADPTICVKSAPPIQQASPQLVKTQGNAMDVLAMDDAQSGIAAVHLQRIETTRNTILQKKTRRQYQETRTTHELLCECLHNVHRAIKQNRDDICANDAFALIDPCTPLFAKFRKSREQSGEHPIASTRTSTWSMSAIACQQPTKLKESCHICWICMKFHDETLCSVSLLFVHILTRRVV